MGCFHTVVMATLTDLQKQSALNLLSLPVNRSENGIICCLSMRVCVFVYSQIFQPESHAGVCTGGAGRRRGWADLAE